MLYLNTLIERLDVVKFISNIDLTNQLICLFWSQAVKAEGRLRKSGKNEGWHE